MSETSSIQTKRNRKQYCTVKLIKYVCQVTFFNVKIEKVVGGNSRKSFAFPVSVWHVGWWNLITSGLRLIQVDNNRNYHFRYFLGVRVRLIKVSFKVNKGNRFWDFDYCPLNIEDVRLIQVSIDNVI